MVDAGFDISPPLTKGEVDRHNWANFIDCIKELYKDDAQVEIKPNYISFNAGEHPKLPFEGHKLLRFSSKVSGSTACTTGVERYIDTVTRVAKVHFGSRIHYWNEFAEQYGIYDWGIVNKSIESYEQADETETPTSIAHFLTGTDPFNDLNIPIFEIKDIPGKGRGLVARFNIASGTRILCEKPLLTVINSTREVMEPLLAAKLKAMPKTSQRQFLSLHNNFPGKYPFSGISKTNALPCGPNSPVGAVYPTICLINHSCVPNAHNNWNSAEGHETIHAVRFIEKGTEITIPYERGGPSSERQAYLKKAFGFTCTCSACTLPTPLLKASDDRRTQIQKLDEAIGDPFRMMNNPQASLQDCYSLLQLLEQESDGCISSPIARVYYDAFQISIAHGDEARGRIFAERAYKARVNCEGEDSPETQRMKTYASKPSAHSTFEAYSRKWQTKPGLVPKGLDTTQFDKWLFRQGR